VYRAISDAMINHQMYWGDDFDQQQAYIDVHGIYTGLSDGTLSRADALTALREIVLTQLRPWLQEDLGALTDAWQEAAATL
jgi:hypothetical protein